MKKERQLGEAGGSCGGQWLLMFRQLCIMNEALIMIAQHLWTEHSPAAELQDVKNSYGGTDAGRQQSFYNTHRHTHK